LRNTAAAKEERVAYRGQTQTSGEKKNIGDHFSFQDIPSSVSKNGKTRR
jgi:hypothetical protein